MPDESRLVLELVLAIWQGPDIYLRDRRAIQPEGAVAHEKRKGKPRLEDDAQEGSLGFRPLKAGSTTDHVNFF